MRHNHLTLRERRAWAASAAELARDRGVQEALKEFSAPKEPPPTPPPSPPPEQTPGQASQLSQLSQWLDEQPATPERPARRQARSGGALATTGLLMSSSLTGGLIGYALAVHDYGSAIALASMAVTLIIVLVLCRVGRGSNGH